MFENLAIVEENCVHVQFSSLRTDKEPLKSVELLKKLQLSYSGSSHSADSSVKGIWFIFLIISFMIYLLNIFVCLFFFSCCISFIVSYSKTGRGAV